MIYNKKTNTIPILVHMPGKIDFIPNWNKFSKCNLTFKHSMPKNLTIITFGNNKHFSNKFNLFEKCLLNNSINYLKLGINVKTWNNSIKINLIYDNLKNIKTKYVLFADNSDVVLVNKIDNIIELFKTFKCKALFNSELIFYPKMVEKNIFDFEAKLVENSFLNAGLWIAELDFVESMLIDLIEMKKNYFTESEQYYYKKIYFEKFPLIQVDHNSVIFQGLNRVSKNEIGFKYDF